VDLRVFGSGVLVNVGEPLLYDAVDRASRGQSYMLDVSRNL
jgi:hypothetical protein